MPRKKRCNEALKRLLSNYVDRLNEINFQLDHYDGNLTESLRKFGCLKKIKGLKKAAEEVDLECREPEEVL